MMNDIMNDRVTVRMNRNLKEQGKNILGKLGMTHSQAITLFYTQIIHHGWLPFELKLPSDELIKALQDKSQSEDSVYTSAKEALDELW